MTSHRKHHRKHKSRLSLDKPNILSFSANLSPVISTSFNTPTPTKLRTELPSGVYLIGCDTASIHINLASAQTMGAKA